MCSHTAQDERQYISLYVKQEKQPKMKGHIMKKIHNDPEMLEEYDFRNSVKGKYAKRYVKGTNVVVIEPDVVKYFPDHDAVNGALRSLAEIIKKQEKKHSEKNIKVD